RVLAVGPGGAPVVGDALEGEGGLAVGFVGRDPAARREQLGPVGVAALLDAPAQELGVEGGQLQRVGAVQDGHIEGGDGGFLLEVLHGPTVGAATRPAREARRTGSCRAVGEAARRGDVRPWRSPWDATAHSRVTNWRYTSGAIDRRKVN